MSIKGSADVQLLPGPEATWINQRTQGIVASRTHAIVYPKNGGTFTQGQKIRLEIPSQDYWDTSLFTISFNLALQAGVPSSLITGNTAWTSPPIAGATTGGVAKTSVDGPLPFGSLVGLRDPQSAIESHWLTTNNGVQSLFQRVRILQGSMVIADILDYNKLNKILKLSNLSKDHVRTSDFVNEGVYDQEDWTQKKMARNFYASSVSGKNTGQYWNVRLNTGFLEIDKYFPVKYTGQITFEIFLDQNTSCLQSSVVGPFSDGFMPSTPLSTFTGGPDPSANFTSYPSPSFVITDVQAHVHFVVPIQEYDEEMLSTINEQGLTIMYSTWNQHTRQITSTGSQIASFQERSVSVRGGLAIMENNVDIGDIRTDYQFSANNIIRFQWKLGNLYIPAQPVECEYGPGRALFELENFMGTVGNMQSSHLIDQQQFLTSLLQKTAANVVGGQPTGSTNTQLVAATANRTYENHKEMRFGNSMPNHFILGLNLEKSPGQLSGFNTSATNVDIELRFNLDTQNSTSGFASNLPPQVGRNGVPTWAANQGTHIFQPSKFKCHDTTDGGAGATKGFYRGDQPDNLSFNGEYPGKFYTPSEFNINISSAAVAAGGAYPAGMNTTGGAAARPTNRFPDCGNGSTQSGGPYNANFGVTCGGTTSTCFLYTKPVATSVLLTFFAYVDAQLNIMKVGQLEVLR